MWLTNDTADSTVPIGVVTNRYNSGYLPLGIADDDDNTTGLTSKASLQPIVSAATTLASSGGALVFSVAVTITSTTSPGASIPKLWTLSVLTSTGVTVDLTSAMATMQVLVNTITINVGSNTGYTGATFTLTASYTYLQQQSGASLVSDMFNNQSSQATQAAYPQISGGGVVQLSTIWFMDGIYETDQYDPLATTAYAIGQPIYAADYGLFTPVSSNASKVGYILAAPLANYTAETKTVSGQSKPRPESLRILLALPRSTAAI